jgi:c-di-AMP phosphodiesterase-like protein
MRGVLRVTSSNEEFNTIMKETKTDDRKMKIKKGEKTFMWYAASPKEAIKFKKKFEESDETEGDETGEDEGFDEE